METSKTGSMWERTNVTNLLRNRQSGKYYARVRVNGKQKWRSLDTAVFSVAKLKIKDAEEAIRGQAITHRNAGAEPGDETEVSRFIALYRARIQANPTLSSGTKLRHEIAIKAVVKTWPDLIHRDIRRLTSTDCQRWAAAALREGTGFIAPNVKTTRKGMSASAFNKCVDSLRAVLEIGRELGVIYQNPAADLAKAPKKKKRLELPTAVQFQAVIKSVQTGGAKWSKDCADLIRLLVYSGARLREASALKWKHLDDAKQCLTIPGTKSDSSYRVVPLYPALGALLAEIRARRGPEDGDAPIARVKTCLGALRSACAAIGVKALTHHELRHLFATRCIESGVDIPTVSRWLGHSDGGTLAMETYGHLRQEHSVAQAPKVKF